MPDLFSDEHRTGTIRAIRRALINASNVTVTGDRKLRQSPQSLAVLIFDEMHARARDIDQLTLFPANA